MKRAPLRSCTPLRRYTPLRQRSKTNSRQPAESSYMKWIRTLRCTVCEVPDRSEAAHTNVLGRAGMARRTNNRSVIPLCAHCHRIANDSYHAITPEDAWSAHHGIDLPALVQRLNGCFELIRQGKRRSA